MDGRNDVFGFNAVADSPVLITITHPISGVIANGSTTAGACDGCNPTDYQLDFPDWTLTAGVSVTVDCGAGLIESVKVVSITGNPDTDTDLVIGDAPPDRPNECLCTTPRRTEFIDDVQVDASGVYTLNFGAEGWDILPGDEFHVYYHAPGGHNVESVFWLPAPEVGLNKWQLGGFARPGGKIVYAIVYWNDGDEVATDVIITDTLPVSTTYAGDTSDLPIDIGANGVITWDLDDLPVPGNGDNWGVFAVTLDVDRRCSRPAALDGNCATISTSTPGDTNPDDNTCLRRSGRCAGQRCGHQRGQMAQPRRPHAGSGVRIHHPLVQRLRGELRPGLADRHAAGVDDGGELERQIGRGNCGPRSSPPAGSSRFTRRVCRATGASTSTCACCVDPNAPEEMLLSNHVVVATPGDAQPDNNERLNEDRPRQQSAPRSATR